MIYGRPIRMLKTVFVEQASKYDKNYLKAVLKALDWPNLSVDKPIGYKQETLIFSAMHVAAFLSCDIDDECHKLYRELCEHMVQRHKKLTYKMISMSHIHVRNVEELESEALYILYNSVLNYNPWRGVRFSTYACNAIRNACWKYAGNNSKDAKQISTVGEENTSYRAEPADDHRFLIETFIKRATALTKIEKYVLQERYLTGRVKTLGEIGAELNVSKERVRQIQKAAISKIQGVVLNEDF